jgi:hypothetical protein
MSWTGVLNAAIPNEFSDRDLLATGSYPGVVPYGERIKRILDWHTDARISTANPYGLAWLLEHIGQKRHRCEGRIPERAGIFEVGEHLQVFIANIADE